MTTVVLLMLSLLCGPPPRKTNIPRRVPQVPTPLEGKHQGLFSDLSELLSHQHHQKKERSLLNVLGERKDGIGNKEPELRWETPKMDF